MSDHVRKRCYFDFLGYKMKANNLFEDIRDGRQIPDKSLSTGNELITQWEHFALG